MEEDFTESTQYNLFKDCLAGFIITKLSAPSKKSTALDAPSNANDDLDEFISYLSTELWPSFPIDLRSLQPSQPAPSEALSPSILDSLPLTFSDTLISYSIVLDRESSLTFLSKIIDEYIEEAIKPLPPWSSTKPETSECEICERSVGLTYHHLIPRSTHDKVLKRGWHDKAMLNSVAWLCRHCHSAVHRLAPNEDLARYYYTVELLMEREEMVRWRNYASKQRWAPRPRKAIKPPT